MVGTDLVVSKVKHFSWGYYPQFTLWSIMYLIPFGIVLGMSYHILLLAYKQEIYSHKQASSHQVISPCLWYWRIGGR